MAQRSKEIRKLTDDSSNKIKRMAVRLMRHASLFDPDVINDKGMWNMAHKLARLVMTKPEIDFVAPDLTKKELESGIKYLRLLKTMDDVDPTFKKECDAAKCLLSKRLNILKRVEKDRMAALLFQRQFA